MTGVKSMQRRGGEELLDPGFVKAISHPLRVEILAECSLAPMSVPEFRDRRGRGQSRQNIEHHFGILLGSGAIEVVDVRPERGGRARYFAATARALFSEEDFNRIPPALRGSLSATTCSTLWERIQESLLAGTLDAHPERHLTWIPLELDWIGFMEIVSELDGMYHRINLMKAEAKERMSRTGDTPMHTTVAMMGFESPPPIRDHDVEM